MRSYIVNLTNNLIGKNRYDDIFRRMGNEDEFLTHVKFDLDANDVHNMTPETLGKVMCSFEIGDVLSAHPGKEVTFSGDCEELLREIVSTCLAYAIRSRLNGESKMPYVRSLSGGVITPGFEAIVGELVQRRQNYLASLKTGQSMVKITYHGKQLTCVYMRHTQDTVTVQTSKEIIDHLFNNGTLCLSGSFTDMNVKFKLNEVQIANG